MNQQETNLDAWDESEPAKPLDLVTMQKLVAERQAQVTISKNMAADKKLIDQKIKEFDMKVLSAFHDAKLKKFHARGLGTISITERRSSKVPKSPQDRKTFYEFAMKYGLSTMLKLHKVDSKELNVFATELQEKAEEAGEVITIPGLEETRITEIISFRKEAVK